MPLESATLFPSFYEGKEKAVLNYEVNEKVNHPSHYTFGKFEVIEVLQDWFKDNPLLWQVGKYIARASHKGNELEDLKKARWYLDYKIKELEKANG